MFALYGYRPSILRVVYYYIVVVIKISLAVECVKFFSAKTASARPRNFYFLERRNIAPRGPRGKVDRIAKNRESFGNYCRCVRSIAHGKEKKKYSDFQRLRRSGDDDDVVNATK